MNKQSNNTLRLAVLLAMPILTLALVAPLARATNVNYLVVPKSGPFSSPEPSTFPAMATWW